MNHNFTVALIAHDHKKEELADFVFEHRAAFSRLHIVATRDTGLLVKKLTGLKVHLMEHGPDGGDQQMGVLAEENEVQAVILFRDPVSAAPYEPDFADLLRVCDTREIPIATNRATAEALIHFLQTSPNRGAITARPWGFVWPVIGTADPQAGVDLLPAGAVA
ncbi:MAG: methylglyoxal synthase [Chloroflexota bacterium]